jgi:hypothetical protein
VEPAGATRRLRDEIAAGRLLSTPFVGTSHEEEPFGVGKHNLPAPRSSFVGREQDMLEAKRLIPMTRLLTLAGAGGSGKTRMALEVAGDLIGAYPDGVWMVALAPLSEEGLVAQEVAWALGVTERPGEPLADTLVEDLGDKDMLLVLDNCEHLIEAAARLAEYLLHSCPRLKVLATSREPLGIAGEVVWQVVPLSLPNRDRSASVEDLMRYEALRLFVDRARLRLPDFELTEKNAGAVARVCRKLGDTASHRACHGKDGGPCGSATASCPLWPYSTVAARASLGPPRRTQGQYLRRSPHISRLPPLAPVLSAGSRERAAADRPDRRPPLLEVRRACSERV